MTASPATLHGDHRPLPATEPDFMLTARVGLAHGDVRRSLIAVVAEPARPDNPWRQSRLLDVAIARTSAHVAAMRGTLSPAARRILPGDRGRVAAYDRAGRAIEHLMRSLHQVLHGDGRAAGRSATSLYSDLAAAFDVYAEREARLLADVQRVAGFEQQRSLLRNIRTALAAAPTRPHPYLPRTLGVKRPVSRIVAGWDGVLDEVHGRSTHRGAAVR